MPGGGRSPTSGRPQVTRVVPAGREVPSTITTRRLAGMFERVTWEHVPRERNRRADALANQAMDAQGTVERPVEGLPRT